MRVVMGAANYWGSPITTGSQHYAKQFARAEWEVAYLSDQISPLHLLRWKSRAYTLDKFTLWLRGGVRDEGERLFAYNHLTLLPVFNAPGLRSRTVADHALDLSIPNIFRKLHREGFADPDLVWVDHLIFADLVPRLKPRLSVYRMADDPRLFPQAYPPPVLERVDHLLREVDLVVVSAEQLFEQVSRSRGSGVVYVPNGVDFDHFARTDLPVPADYAAIPPPRVVYAGSIEEWFDTELVSAAAQAHPDVSFVIIGPARIDLGELRGMRNVHLLGKRPYVELPAYLHHAHVGIIPFRVSTHMDAVNPIKLYEYLAAGLPVVAPSWRELEVMRPPAALVKGTSEFVDAITDAIEHPGEPDIRRAYARANSWNERFARLRATLGLEE